MMQDAKKLQWDSHRISQKSLELADMLLSLSRKELSGDARRFVDWLSLMSKEPLSYAFTTQLIKNVLLCPQKEDAEQRLKFLTDSHKGIPRCYGLWTGIGASLRSYLPGGSKDTLRKYIQKRFSPLYAIDSDAVIAAHLKEDEREGMTSSLQACHPRVSGDVSCAEYTARLRAYIGRPQPFTVEIDLRRVLPKVDPYQIDTAVARLHQYLIALFKGSFASQSLHPLLFVQAGRERQEIAARAIISILSKKEFAHLDFGMELSAYLPDSAKHAEIISALAAKREKKGLPAIKLRIIKGDHLEDECLGALRGRRAELMSMSRSETDSRYKLLVLQCLKMRGVEAVFGTHNLFELSFVLLASARYGTTARPSFCFERGVSSHTAAVLRKLDAQVYLQSRFYRQQDKALVYGEILDFLHDATREYSCFVLSSKTLARDVDWMDMGQRFLLSAIKMDVIETLAIVPDVPYLSSVQKLQTREALHASLALQFEQHVDFIPALFENKAVSDQILMKRYDVQDARKLRYSYATLQHNHIKSLIGAAKSADKSKIFSRKLRANLLEKLMRLLEENRPLLVAALARDAGHSLRAADFELGQAIAFCRFYLASMKRKGLTDGTLIKEKSLATVLSSAIRPLADAIEGIAASFLMGCSVIWKPSNHALCVSGILWDLFKKSNLGEPLIYRVQCLDNQFAEILANSAKVDICFAYMKSDYLIGKSMKPHAEEIVMRPHQGICSVILTQDASWRLAIEECVDAFALRSGQCASAPHVLIVADSLYDSKEFQSALKDAVSSLRVGPSMDADVNFPPRAHPLDAKTHQLLSSLHGNESWLVAPSFPSAHSSLYRPSIRMSARLDSPIFAEARLSILPQIVLMRARDLESAFLLQENLSAGSHAGIYTRNHSVIKAWRKRMNFAHYFINRAPEQCLPALLPAGALKDSFHRSGGSYFVASLAEWSEQARPQIRSKQCSLPFAPWEMIVPRLKGEDMMRLRAAADSISHCWESEFSRHHSLESCHGQWTELYYVPRALCIRADKKMRDVDLGILLLAALTASCKVYLSLEASRAWTEGALALLGVTCVCESRDEFEARLPALSTQIKLLRDSHASAQTILLARELGIHVLSDDALSNGHIELMHVCEERYCSGIDLP